METLVSRGVVRRMPETPMVLMYEKGIEGHLFNPHARSAQCEALGCVPVPVIDATIMEDAARYRWLAARAERGISLWLFHLRCYPGETIEQAMDRAMDKEVPDARHTH